MNNKLKKYYEDFYMLGDVSKAYPNEYVTRIFRGNYPRLNLSEKSNYADKKILDIGCGDGRNLRLLNDLGFKLNGTEITKQIAHKVQKDLKSIGVVSKIVEGFNHNLPFKDKEFDYLLSWNSSYYMGEQNNYLKYEEYVKEFARVLKAGGKLILSIPMLSHSIYNNSVVLNMHYRMIINDRYNIRNGQVFKAFSGRKEIVEILGKYFTNFKYGSLRDDCFGIKNHHHLVVCERNKTE